MAFVGDGIATGFANDDPVLTNNKGSSRYFPTVRWQSQAVPARAVTPAPSRTTGQWHPDHGYITFDESARAGADGFTGEVAMPQKFTIRADWDEEAKVWVATSDDVLGLATEADTIPELVEKLERILPELLVENGQLDAADGLLDVPFCVMHEHVARLPSH
ncbi:MAG TPA: DUF1902 domain-containing protein [Terriglobales bacterium]|nr:DUF1902 domain-containing protein [Terriglobales bacterium]